MVFGRINKEMIGLNEETLWTKQNPDRRNPDSLAHLAEIRQLLLDGKPLEANFVAEYASFGRPHYQSTYQTLATLKLLLLDHQTEWATDYRRSIDLESGRHHRRLPARRRPAPPRGLRVAARRRGGGAPRVVGARACARSR